jgi:UDP-N-acetylglucosamine 2-epimerase (non-hydrolysing)
VINETTKIINQLANEFDSDFDWKFIKHPNPLAQAGYDSEFKSNPNITFLNPLLYPEMLMELSESYLVLTDSGGFQEESTYLGIPTLVIRKTTERPEAISSGCCELVADPTKMLEVRIREILSNEALHQKMSHSSEIFGVGESAKKILDVLKKL